MKENSIFKETFRVVFIYLIISTLFIIISDIIVFKSIEDLRSIKRVQTFKELVYITVTVIIIFLLTLRRLGIQEKIIDELNKSKNLISRLFNSTPNGQIIINAKDYYSVLINKSFKDITGLSEDFLMARSIIEMDLFPDVLRINEWIKKIESGEQVHNEDTRIKTVTGDIKDVLVTFEFVEINEEKLIFIIINDISERKEYERVLSQFKQIFEISNDLSAIIDRDFVYRFANNAYYYTFGKKPDEIIGRKVEDVLGKDAFQQILKGNLEKAFKGETVKYQFWVNIQNRNHFMDVTYKPFYDEYGIINGVLSSAHPITDLKLSEMQAIENEKKYKNLFNNSEVGMFRTRIDGTEILEFNERFLAILNYSNNEVIGNPSIDFWVYKKEREIMVQMLKANGRVSNYECSLYNKQKEVLRCLTSLILYSETGILEGSIIDITERKKAEKELIKAKVIAEENEIKNKLILDNVPVVIWKSSQDGETIYISESIERVYGFTQKEIYENNEILWLNRIHPNDFNKVIRQLDDLFKNNKPFEVEYRIKNKDGKWIWLHDISNKVIKENDIQYAYGIFYDVTKRKRIEDELRESEEKFQKAFMSNPSPLLITTLEEGIIVEVNFAFQNTFNYSLQEVIGKTTHDLRFFDKNEKTRKELLKHIKSDGNIHDLEIKMITKDGDKYDCIVNAELLHLNDKPYIFTIINNISELKKANKELEFYKSKLENLVESRTRELKNAQQKLIQSEKMASIGLLSAGIAHEINNPINYIRGGITGLNKTYNNLKNLILRYKDDILNQRTKDRKYVLPDIIQLEEAVNTADKMFDGINEGINRTIKIINSLHVFSSNSTDKFEQVIIPELIHSALLLLSNTYKNKIIIHELYAEDSIVNGIPGKLQQVFMNVLSNAIQAIPDKGEISINTKWNNSKDKLIISITDNGMGISQEIKKKIFDPFFTTKDVGEGTGLGLYLSYNYIQQHSGKIEIKSQKDQGTEFIIELPKTQIDNG